MARLVSTVAFERRTPGFEDAVLNEEAATAGASAIVTRNVKDFKRATIAAHSN
ncbi:MAG: hypothetical protein ACT4OM_04865 [Actinomycetota bacterium]